MSCMSKHTGFFKWIRNRNNSNEVILTQFLELKKGGGGGNLSVLHCTFRTTSSSWFYTFHLDNPSIKRWNVSSNMYFWYLVQLPLCESPWKFSTRHPLPDMFEKTFLTYFFVFSLSQNKQIFLIRHRTFSSHVCGDKTRSFGQQVWTISSCACAAKPRNFDIFSSCNCGDRKGYLRWKEVGHFFSHV